MDMYSSTTPQCTVTSLATTCFMLLPLYRDSSTHNHRSFFRNNALCLGPRVLSLSRPIAAKLLSVQNTSNFSRQKGRSPYWKGPHRLRYSPEVSRRAILSRSFRSNEHIRIARESGNVPDFVNAVGVQRPPPGFCKFSVLSRGWPSARGGPFSRRD